ncbi:hypothetical protein RI367_002348 [Sorochytrium milnesiophthora]
MRPLKIVLLTVLCVVLAQLLFTAALYASVHDWDVDWSGMAPSPILTKSLLTADRYLRQMRAFVMPPSAQIAELAAGFMTSKALFTVCLLGVPDLLRKRPLSTAELAEQTNAIPDRLERVMQHLAVYDIFALSEDHKWHNTRLSGVLRQDHPNSVLDLVLHITDESYESFLKFDQGVINAPRTAEQQQQQQTSSDESHTAQTRNSSQFVVESPSERYMQAHGLAIGSEIRNSMDSINQLQLQYSQGPIDSKPPPTAWDLTHDGVQVWDWFAQPTHERHLRRFTRAMEAMSRMTNPGLISDFDWGKFDGQVVCDVGGGSGTFLAALLTAYPTLKGILFDSPEVIDEAKREWKEKYPADLLNRVEFASGSFFDGVPAGADVYSLRSILHDWDDYASLRILRVIRQQIAANQRETPGALIWIDQEMFVPQPLLTSIADMQMMAMLGGRERWHEQKVALIRSANFEFVETARTRVLYSIMHVKPV